jgi:hypothetical protein
MFETKILPGILTRHTAVGEIGLTAISRAHVGWFEDPNFNPDTPVLWDCRNQFLNISLVELADLHKYTLVNTDSRRSPGSRSAILVSYEISKSALEATIVKNTHVIATFKAFTEESEALDWLGLAQKVAS